jgi:hypothetical protein
VIRFCGGRGGALIAAVALSDIVLMTQFRSLTHVGSFGPRISSEILCLL